MTILYIWLALLAFILFFLSRTGKKPMATKIKNKHKPMAIRYPWHKRLYRTLTKRNPEWS